METEALTASRLRAFRSCPRLHRYRYMDCREPIPNPELPSPRRFGTAVHRALETWWLLDGSGVEERLYRSLAALQGTGLDHQELVLATELTRGYHFHWLEQPLRTIAVEQEFEIPLVNPESGHASSHYVLRGKVDGLVMDERDRRQYLIEHKTTSIKDISEGSLYWRRLRMDGQISVYYSAFPDVAGCVYDVIRIPPVYPYKATPEEQRTYTKGKRCKLCQIATGFAQRTLLVCPACRGSGWEEEPRLYKSQRAEDESPDEYAQRVRAILLSQPDEWYKRAVVVRLPNEIREHGIDLWQQAELMQAMATEGISPRNPDACYQYGGLCDYFDVCTGAADINDDRLFQIKPKHPELNGGSL